MDQTTKLRFQQTFAKGELFEGKFRIEGHLGTGSFAYVMLAKHEAMERRVALKVLKPDLVNANPELLKRFVNEVKIVAKLTHPNTVTVFDYGRTADNVHYLVMEYVEGVTLEDVLAEQGALAPHRAVLVTKQILKSLAEAHSLGIVHRDLKPSNIMLTYSHDEQEIVKVLDFGVAKLVDHQSTHRGKPQRRSTQFVGTPVYMSPEQVLGTDVVPASDLYSLGLILYEMLTGSSPFTEPTVALIAQAHVDDEPLPFAHLDRLTARFQTLILRATARQPQNRFTDVGSFARALPTIGATDFSAEFSKLMDDGGLAEESPAVEDWDAFSGKNYVEAPASEAVFDEPIARSKAPKPAQPVRLNVETEAPRRPLGGVALDLGHVRRDELQRKRDVTVGTPVVVVERDWKSAAWILGGMGACFAAFVLASTVFVDGNGPDRWFVGFLPMGIAALWSRFSGVQRHHGSQLETMVVPFFKHMVLTLGVLLLVVCVAMPESGASRMANAGTWFVDDVSKSSPLRLVHTVTETVASVFAWLFAFSSKVIPW